MRMSISATGCFLKEKIYKVEEDMPIVDAAIIRKLEKETDYDYQFSSRFECRMKN